MTRGEATWQDYRRTGVGHSIDDVMAERRATAASRRANFDKP